jgi:hypothetical protein
VTIATLVPRRAVLRGQSILIKNILEWFARVLFFRQIALKGAI